MKSEAEELGFEIEDLSYDLDKMAVYDESDLHIGYRVHAHIYCLSHRVKSILIHEDGRGEGVSQAINLQGINAYMTLVDENSKIRKIVNDYTRKSLTDYIQELEESDYKVFDNVQNTLKTNFKSMEKFLELLP
ncbi:hypothetical protein [Clostridium sp.]|uniref:hypothetical protein n=1 Tax=Clostridium sp. TaxID=1506 RepID=UPI0032163714